MVDGLGREKVEVSLRLRRLVLMRGRSALGRRDNSARLPAQRAPAAAEPGRASSVPHVTRCHGGSEGSRIGSRLPVSYQTLSNWANFSSAETVFLGAVNRSRAGLHTDVTLPTEPLLPRARAPPIPSRCAVWSCARGQSCTRETHHQARTEQRRVIAILTLGRFHSCPPKISIL